MDTVLFGGLGFLVLVGVSFLIISKIDNSDLTETKKRTLNYVVISILIIITILVFKWHSTTYLVSN
jgi:TRAP-type C4-dicarboxylate transport system permease large subunit